MKITIPSPCSENWATMTATDKGQFCASCQKCVVDFTAMTDTEIVRYLNRNEGKTCGRFTKEQLNRPLAAPNRLTIPLAKWVLASTFSLGLISPKQGFAAVPMVQTQPSFVFFEKEKKAQKADNELITTILSIHGSILDSLSNGIVGASIVLKGTTKGVVSDIEGNFVLDIPIGQNITLVISAAGYKGQEIVIQYDNTHKKVEIKMAEEIGFMGEVIVTQKASWWRRAKHFFRKRNY